MTFTEKNKRYIAAGMLLLLAMLSFFVLARKAESAETYEKTITALEEKKTTVMALSATSVAASTALAAVPGDVTTPIANQIMEIGEYLFIVVCFLVLEKTMLTVMGYLAFRILIPVACLLLCVHIFFNKGTLKILACKFIVFAMALVMLIPFSVKISDLVYESNREAVEMLTDDLNKELESQGESKKESGEDKNWLQSMLDKVTGAVSDAVSSAGTHAKRILSQFVDAIALFVIVYCAIPIIVIAVMIWFINFLFGLSVQLPQPDKLIRRQRTEHEGE